MRDKDEEFIKFNRDDKYDIKTNNGKYEIKTDSNYKKYNSIFAEFMSNNKSSGIAKTKADYFVFVGPNNILYESNDIFIFEINILNHVIQKYKNELIIKNAPCRDYKNNVYAINKGYILPQKILKKYAVKYTIKLNEYDDLNKLITELV